jgi:hypothetical protein
LGKFIIEYLSLRDLTAVAAACKHLAICVEKYLVRLPRYKSMIITICSVYTYRDLRDHLGVLELLNWFVSYHRLH